MAAIPGPLKISLVKPFSVSCNGISGSRVPVNSYRALLRSAELRVHFSGEVCDDNFYL